MNHHLTIACRPTDTLRAYVLIVLAALFSFCFGQSLATAQPAEPVGMEFSLVGLGALPDKLSFRDKSKIVTFELPKSGRGEPIRYGGASPLVLFTERIDAEGKTIQVPVASISYSANWTRVLAVLVSGGREDAPIRTLAFDDSPEGFPVDHARLFNFYSRELAVSNDGKVEQIASGDSSLFQLQNRNGRTWMKLAARKGDAWQPLPAYVTQITPGMRLLVFAYEQRTPEGVMEPIYRTINETPPALPQEVAMR